MCLCCILYSVAYAILFGIPLMAIISKRIRAKMLRTVVKIINKTQKNGGNSK